MLANRYDIDPDRLKGQKSITDYIIEANKSIKVLETSLQAGHTAIEDGDFVVRNGDIIVSESDDTVVMRIRHGVTPEVRMFPLGGTDTHIVSLYGFDVNGDPNNPDQAVQLYIARESDFQPDGGKVQLTRNYAVFSYQPFGAEEMFMRCDAFGYWWQGKFLNAVQSGTQDAVYVGSFTATSGFTTWTHTYFSPFASGIVPVFTVGVAGTTLQWGIESYSTSAFTVRFSTTSGTKIVTFWNFRH